MINQDEALAQIQLSEIQLKLMSQLGFQWAYNNHLSQLQTINREATQKCVYDSYILGSLSLIEIQKEVLIPLHQQEEWNMVHIFINDRIDNASQSSFEQVGQISQVYISSLQTYYIIPDSYNMVPFINNNNVEVLKIKTEQIPFAFLQIQQKILNQNKKLVVLFNINVGMNQKKWKSVCFSIQEMVRNLKPTDLVGAILFERTPVVFHSLAQYENKQFQSLSQTYNGQLVSSDQLNEQMNEQLITRYPIQRQSHLKKCCLYFCLPMILILFLITIFYSL